MKASEHLMSFLSYPNLPEGCEDRRIAELVHQCFILACNIYTNCANSTDVTPEQGAFYGPIPEQAIQQLIDKMLQISPNVRGAHALVWVSFVAGAASTSQMQRAFFVERMNQVYERTKFRNIPTAIRSLVNIWSREDGKRWTLCLPLLSNVLVM